MQRVLLFILIIFWPSIAFANTWAGAMIFYSAYFVLLLPVIVLAELPNFRRRLALPWRRAITLITWANIVSTIIGVLVGIVYDFGIVVADPYGLGGLILTIGIPIAHFYLSYRIELRVVRHYLVDRADENIRNALLWANGTSYFCIISGVGLWLIWQRMS